jgi:hypothetical protein
MPIPINPTGGPLTAKLEILSAHIGSYAIDIWDDADGSGTPSSGDKFVKRAKDFGDNVTNVALGSAAEMKSRTVRFIWGVTAGNTGDTKSRVRVSINQGEQPLSGFPRVVEANFQPGQHYDVFHVFYFLS